MSTDSSSGSVTRWIRELKDGNKDALSKLWQRYFPKAKQKARHHFGTDSRTVRDEEDIALSVMGALFKDASLLDVTDREDLIRLLLVVTKRKVLSEKRSQKSLSRGGGKVNIVTDLSDLLKNFVLNRKGEMASPDSIAVMSEQYQILMNALPDDFHRDIVKLKLKGKTIQEVADDLNVVPRTIHRKLKHIQTVWIETLGKSDFS
jgi:DNA-directed RNA polymerase specialized sigma24 family protein